MFTKKENKLQKRIDDLLDEMETVNGDSPEYARMADQLIKLHDAKDRNKSSHVSPDAVVAVVGNLAGLLVIVNYERANVITSKAFNLLFKNRT